jgi:hypothetical protein
MARKQQARPDSQAESSEAEPQAQAPTEDQAQASNAGVGNVSSMPASPPPRVRYSRVRERLMATPEWPKVKAVLAEMRADPKLAPLSAEAREQFIWAELDRLYPPMRETASTPKSATPDPDTTCEISKAQSSALLPDSGRVQGLGDLPPGWPELPANASLTAEIGWVQANRLYVVEELERGGTRVRLDRAHEPAPSRAAIGWLETSIRSYAKYVEVAAKATGAGQDEQAQERAERLDLDDVRALLAEML